MKVFSYLRVSSIMQVDNTSLTLQRQQIEAYCLLKGFDLVHTFCDAGVSGGMPIDERLNRTRFLGHYLSLKLPVLSIDDVCIPQGS
jgi:DNA invertase Pin-like site-specific DNA recombinase